MLLNKKKLAVGVFSTIWLAFSGVAAADQSAGTSNNGRGIGEGTYFEKLRLNTQKFESVQTGNYLREDYICQQVPSACRDANGQEPEDRWYPALPAYTQWQDEGAPHSHENWLPAPGTQLEDFQQTQAYLQPQSRLRQEREQAVPSGDYRNVGEPQEENRDAPRTDSRTVNTTVLSFVPDGNSLNCSTWLPETSTVNMGEMLTQTRNCEQNATRDVEYYVDGVLMDNATDDGVVTVEESQEVEGTRDHIINERADAWSEWADVGGLYDCGPWAPTPDTQPLEAAFTQTADCSQNQTRTRQVYNVFYSGAETKKRVDTENQTIPRQDSREAIGAKDYMNGERIGDWENDWEVVMPQVNTNCGPWSPATNTIDWGNRFTQTRTCDTNEEDFRTIYDVYKSGKEVPRETERRQRTVQVQETQSVDGTRDFVASTYDIDGAWINQGSLYNCVWTPDPDTIDVGTEFTQNAECDRNQKRTITTMNVWASKPDTGREDTVASTRDENRTIKENTSRTQTGTGAPVIQYGAWGAWSTTSSQDCTVWSPAANTINWGQSFTQTRDCDYNQERFRSRTNVYPSGRTEALSDQRDTRLLETQPESRTETGSRDYEASTRTVNGAWTNSGGTYSCTWTPDPATIDVGTNFTQTGDCSQNQTRTVTVYTVWASKPDTGREDTVKTTATENRTIDVASTRSSTGTGNPTIQYGAWGAYSTYAVRDCTAWSPGTGAVTYGQSFTQSRTCTYDQERFRSRTNVYPSGRTEALSAQRGTRALTGQAESRGATGTKEEETSTYVTYSNWSNSGSAYNCTWSPNPATIDVGTPFTQTGACSQNQTRTATTWSKWASGKADSVKSTATQSRTVSTSPTRSQTGTGQPTIQYGTWGAYSTYNKTACTTWSPAESTVNLGTNFTQRRTCTYEQERFRSRTNVYPSGRREALSPQRGTRALTGQAESRTRSGTKDYITSTYYTYSSWATVANDKSCTGWTPATSSIDVGSSFTQTRTCVDGQARTRTTKYKWASGRADTTGPSIQQSRDINDNQSRGATGTGQPVLQCGAFGGWSTYSKFNCTSWGAATSTVNWGVSFTQNRTCTYRQERFRECEYVYPSGRRVATTDGERGTRHATNQTESRSAVGTRDYVTGEYTTCSGWVNSGSPYSCSTYSPSTSTRACGTSFTQTRSCSQNQVRTCRVMQRWASGKADTEKSRSTPSQTVPVTQSRSATGGATNGIKFVLYLFCVVNVQ